MSVLFFLVSAPGGKIDGRTSTSQWMCVPGSKDSAGALMQEEDAHTLDTTP